MKKLLYPILLLSTLLIAVASCKKDKNTTTAKTKAELLALAPWKYSKLESGSSATGPWASITNPLPCINDDVYTFKSTGTYERNNGTSKCSNTEPATSTGNWSLTNNDNTLTVEGRSITSFEITETSLALVGQESGFPGYFRTTFVH